MILPRLALFLLLFTILLSTSLPSPAQSTAPLEKGVVHPRIPCAADPSQTYALYIPTSYDPARPAPILFALDPSARGSLPVQLYKAAAEKFGFLLAGSNNSRNGPYRIQRLAAEAMTADAAARFSIDPRRVYLVGFSGGARAAVSLAATCGDCIAGVIALGAGFPEEFGPSAKTSFALFLAVGTLDFNYPELLELSAKLDALSLPNRLRRFDGPHRWPPPDVALESLEWLELIAIRQSRRPADPAFLSSLFEKSSRRALDYQSSGNLLFAAYEYRKLISDFSGLADTSSLATTLSRLESSPAFRSAFDREQADLRKQQSLTRQLSTALANLHYENVDSLTPRVTLRDRLASFRKSSFTKDGKPRSVASQRALSTLTAQAIESGEAALRDKDTSLALAYFDCATALAPDSPGPWFLLARTSAALGRKSRSLEALRTAVACGFNRRDLIIDSPEFASLRSDPAFEKILASIPAPPPAQ